MKTAFLSYKYNPETEPIALLLRGWFKVHDIQIVDGKDLDASLSLNEQIKNRIDDSDLIISIRTAGESSTYVVEEAAYAEGAKKPVIIVSQGVFDESSLLRDQYYIDLEKGFEASNDLSNAVVKILERENLDLDAKKVKHTPQDEIDAEGWGSEVRKSLKLVHELFNESEIDKAYESSTQLIEKHPDCWRGSIALSACCIILSRYDEAESVLDASIEKFSGSGRALSYAYQNQAWLIFERDRGSDKEVNQNLIEAYRKSIAAYPRKEVYIDLIMTYLDADVLEEAEKVVSEALIEFDDFREKLKDMVDSQGASFVQMLTKSNILSALTFSKKS